MGKTGSEGDVSRFLRTLMLGTTNLQPGDLISVDIINLSPESNRDTWTGISASQMNLLIILWKLRICRTYVVHMHGSVEVTFCACIQQMIFSFYVRTN